MRATRENTRHFDLASKELLKGENIRAGILKYLIEDYRDMEVSEIKPLISDLLPSEDLSIPEKNVAYDILFTAKLPNSNDEVGIIIDIEPQGYHQSDEELVTRAFQYCSRLIIRQDDRDTKEKGKWKYGKLKKVYSVWIITVDKKKRGEMFSIKYQLSTKMNKNPFLKEYYDKTEMVFIYPEVVTDKEEIDIVSLLSLLFSLNVDTNDKSDMLKSKYDIEVSEQEKDAMFGFLDKNDEIIKKKFEDAKAESKAEGLAEGITKGSLNTAVSTIKAIMKSLNIDVDKAMEIAGYTEEFKEKVKEAILDDSC